MRSVDSANSSDMFLFPDRNQQPQSGELDLRCEASPDFESSAGSGRSNNVWKTRYPNKYNYGLTMQVNKVQPKWNYMAISQEDNCIALQRIKFPQGKSKLTPLGKFAPQGKKYIRLTPNIRHNRHIEFGDSDDEDRYVKQYASLVVLQLEPDRAVFPSSGEEDEDEDEPETISLNIYIEPSASDTASCTRQGWSSFVVPGLPDGHPYKLVSFRCTVVQQSHTRRPDGIWCWGPDTSIRCITIEVEDCIVTPRVSHQINDHLKFSDNPIDATQQTAGVLWEDHRVQKEASAELAASEHPRAESIPPQRRLTDRWTHGFDLAVTAVYTDGCVCRDMIDCKFCKGPIPEYQRLWAQYVADGHHRDDCNDTYSQGMIHVVPAYDESGVGDTILHDRAGHLTQAGRQWLCDMDTDTSVELPSYEGIPLATE